MNYYLKVLKNYAVFTGRARRSEYWYFVLFNFIFSCVVIGLDNILGTTFKMDILGAPVHANIGYMGSGFSHLPYGYITLSYALAILLPNLAVSVRRLHDVGKSGWFLLIGLIPLVGAIWLLVLYFTDGIRGPNQYGEDPKAPAPETV